MSIHKHIREREWAAKSSKKCSSYSQWQWESKENIVFAEARKAFGWCFYYSCCWCCYCWALTMKKKKHLFFFFGFVAKIFFIYALCIQGKFLSCVRCFRFPNSFSSSLFSVAVIAPFVDNDRKCWIWKQLNQTKLHNIFYVKMSKSNSTFFIETFSCEGYAELPRKGE